MVSALQTNFNSFPKEIPFLFSILFSLLSARSATPSSQDFPHRFYIKNSAEVRLVVPDHSFVPCGMECTLERALRETRGRGLSEIRCGMLARVKACGPQEYFVYFKGRKRAAGTTEPAKADKRLQGLTKTTYQLALRTPGIWPL